MRNFWTQQRNSLDKDSDFYNWSLGNNMRAQLLQDYQQVDDCVQNVEKDPGLHEASQLKVTYTSWTQYRADPARGSGIDN